MTIVQTANQPIAFSGQIVAYAHDGTYQEKTIVDVVNTPVAFSSAIIRFDSATGGNPAQYTSS